MPKTLTPEQIRKLKEPLPSEAIKQHPTKTYLSTIKAIYEVERLNDVFGIGSWKLRSKVIDNTKAMIIVQSTLSIPEYDIELESYGGNDNGGENSKGHDEGDAYKGAVTDAFTKICSYLEIGIDVFKGKGSTTNNEQQNGNNTIKSPLDIAINKMAECKTLDEVKTCWTKFKTLQTEKRFIDKKEEMKKQLSEPALN